MASQQKSRGEAPIEIDLHAIYYAFRERAGVILVVTAVALIGAAVYLYFAPKMYRSQAIVQIEQAERKVVTFNDLATQDLQNAETLKTYEANLSNWSLLARVAKNPELNLTPASLAMPARPDRPYPDAEIIDHFAKCVSVRLVRGTRLITIECEVADPIVAGMVPNAIVDEHKRMVFEEHEAASREASKFLLSQADALKAKLDHSKQALQKYREDTKAVALEDSRNTVDASLRDLNVKLTEAKTASLRLESDYAQVQEIGDDVPERLLAVSSIATAPAVLEQKKNVAAQEADLANLSRRYLPKHPRYIAASGRLDELKAGLDRAILGAADGLATALRAAHANEAKIEEATRQQEAKSLDLGRLAIGYEALLRESDSDNALYQNVLNRLKETDVLRGIQPDVVRLVQRSDTPGSPSKPRRLLVLAIALAAGLTLGTCIALLRIALDRSLKTVDQAEGYLQLPVLAAVQRESSRRRSSRDIPVVAEPHGAIAESFRTLRTSLALLGESGRRRTFLFTSAVPGEGKSFSASNFAASLAQQGHRTLIIDADLRMPTLEKVFFDQAPHSGLADVLLADLPLNKAWRDSKIPNLAVMTVGNRPHNCAELLAWQTFDRILLQAQASFDAIVIDSAPIHAVSDTLLLVKLVECVCLVVHSAKTPRNAVARAVRKLGEAGAQITGVVLNFLPRHGGGYHYHYSQGAYGEGVYGAPSRAARR
jgi:capsular exopolysaccharide synthesis family protein